MSIITLTSDYGLVDYRVAAVKGAILSQTTNVQIVDISHEIEAYNLTQAAYIVRNAYKHFPKNSVHILCIEAVYRKEVKPIVYKIDGHYFISADNGLLSLIFPDISPDGVYEITLKRFDEDIKSVVMDIFVPVATYLADGGIPEVIGREYKTPKESVAENPIHNESENMIVGRVMYIDNYGNLITNINKKIFTRAKINHERYRLIFRDIALSTIHETQMASIKNWDNEIEHHGKAVAFFNEGDWLELGIYKGKKGSGAHTLFGINVGEKIYVEFFN